MAERLAAVSFDLGRQVGLLLNRRGEVEYVVVGDRQKIELPDFKRVRTGSRRFRGLRCVHTHLPPGEGLTRDDLNDLTLLRLDAMTALTVDGQGRPCQVYTAHLAPPPPGGVHDLPLEKLWTLLPPVSIHRLELDFDAFIRELEAEFLRAVPVQSRHAAVERGILVGVSTGPLADEEERLEELAELARTVDVDVIDTVLQRRQKFDPRFLMGRGKLQEIVLRGMQAGATLLIFDRDLSPTQVRSICAETDLKVLDRTQLILDIFARRARSQEGKIQVELAQLRYLMPRLAERDDALSRLTGGIGGRGPGETSLEVNKRAIRTRIRSLEGRLDGVRRSRRQQRKARQRQDVPVVSIVGYTNAGKSTLFNRMTQAGVLAEDRLFATLDPVSRRLHLPSGLDTVLSDTVGFIRDLPKDLVEAFKATLEQIEDSDLIVHLVDGSTEHRDTQITAVERILAELGLGEIPTLLVFNKADRLAWEERQILMGRSRVLLLSALTGEGLPEFLEELARRLPEPAPPFGYNPGDLSGEDETGVGPEPSGTI